MNILLTILGLLALSALVCVFWWAMIEAQTDIPGVNEPNTKHGRSAASDEDDEMCLADIFDAMEAQQEEAMERLNDWRYEQEEVN
jgi:hypothetical protein